MKPSKLFHPTRLREVRFMKRWLATQSAGAICDFGCGDGFYSRWIAGDREVVGFDPWPSEIRKAPRDDSGRSLFFVGDATHAALPNEAFTAVISVCVLEHIEEVDRAFAEAQRVLMPGGLFLFSVDSLDGPSMPPDYVAHHRKRFYIAEFLTLGTVKALLDANGFEMLEHTSVGNNRISGAILRLFARRYSVYRWFSPLLSAAAWFSDIVWNDRDHGYILMFAARKKE